MTYISLECLFLGRDVKWSLIFLITPYIHVLMLARGSPFIVFIFVQTFLTPSLFGPRQKPYHSV